MMSSRQRLLLKMAGKIPDADESAVDKAALVVRQGMLIDLPVGDSAASTNIPTADSVHGIDAARR
jgi:hypothetical protein